MSSATAGTTAVSAKRTAANNDLFPSIFFSSPGTGGGTA
jgi:hypothetical protein